VLRWILITSFIFVNQALSLLHDQFRVGEHRALELLCNKSKIWKSFRANFWSTQLESPHSNHLFFNILIVYNLYLFCRSLERRQAVINSALYLQYITSAYGFLLNSGSVPALHFDDRSAKLAESTCWKSPLWGAVNSTTVAHKWTKKQTEEPLLSLQMQSYRYGWDFWTPIGNQRQLITCTHGQEHPHNFPRRNDSNNHRSRTGYKYRLQAQCLDGRFVRLVDRKTPIFRPNTTLLPVNDLPTRIPQLPPRPTGRPTNTPPNVDHHIL